MQRDLQSGQNLTELAFEFRKLRFTYHPESNTFERLKFPVHEPFDYYLKASGYGTPDKVGAAVQQWGLNKFEVRFVILPVVPVLSDKLHCITEAAAVVPRGGVTVPEGLSVSGGGLHQLHDIHRELLNRQDPNVCKQLLQSQGWLKHGEHYSQEHGRLMSGSGSLWLCSFLLELCLHLHHSKLRQTTEQPAMHPTPAANRSR